jgi:hypothetical protein
VERAGEGSGGPARPASGLLLAGPGAARVAADVRASAFEEISELPSPGGEIRAQAAGCRRFRSAMTARMPSQSTSLKLCIGQYFGPHIEQNSADLK